MGRASLDQSQYERGVVHILQKVHYLSRSSPFLQGNHMTFSSFRCARCGRGVLIRSRSRNVFERLSSRLGLVRYYRCKSCSRRYTGIGLGRSRLLIHQKTSQAIRDMIVLTLYVFGVIALFSLLT